MEKDKSRSEEADHNYCVLGLYCSGYSRPTVSWSFVNVIIDGLRDDCVIVPVVKGEFWIGLTANFVVLLLFSHRKS